MGCTAAEASATTTSSHPNPNPNWRFPTDNATYLRRVGIVAAVVAVCIGGALLLVNLLQGSAVSRADMINHPENQVSQHPLVVHT